MSPDQVSWPLTVHIDGRPRTVAPVRTVPGARPDGGEIVLRRQVVEGFGDFRPSGVAGAGVELVCRQEAGASLLSVLKNVVDGLDQHGILSSDRTVDVLVAVFDPEECETTVKVNYIDEEFEAGIRNKYPSGGLLEVSSATMAAPVGVRPLVSPSGDAVDRDVDSYVADLLDQWDELSLRLDEATLATVRALPECGPYRLEMSVQSGRTADLENVVARVVHLLHVGTHSFKSRDAYELWDAEPALEDQIQELVAVRTALPSAGLTVTLTPIADTTEPLIDLRIERLLRENEATLPQIELATDSPRLGQAKKSRKPK